MSSLSVKQKMALDAPLALSSPDFIEDIRLDLARRGVARAVADRDTPTIFDWLITLVPLQGISDRAATTYASRNPIFRLTDFLGAAGCARCSRLGSYWAFSECRYVKAAPSCAEPRLLRSCPVPQLPMRNGRLSQAAASLALFFRDVCGGDFVSWVDERLQQADHDDPRGRTARMRAAVLEPMTAIYGVSSKVLSMALADLLLGGDPSREQWVATGATMIAVDSLVHNFLHRTGLLSANGCGHPYGPQCYQPGGCADLIERLSETIDARAFNPAFPGYFPRFVQHAVWRFCAADGWNVCNGNRIDDHKPCRARFCPVRGCLRQPLGGHF